MCELHISITPKYVAQFWLIMTFSLQASFFSRNMRFVLGNVVLQMSQILVPTTPGQQIGNPYRPEELKMVDADGGWMMEAHVKVASNTDVEAVNLAYNELSSVREQLAGVVNLAVVERLALDPRWRT